MKILNVPTRILSSLLLFPVVLIILAVVAFRGQNNLTTPDSTHTELLHTTTFPDSSWETQQPSRLGLDESKLDQFANNVGGTGVIIKNGYLVKSWGGNIHGEWASATKPLLSTLLFFAIEEDRVPHVHYTVSDLGWELTDEDQSITFSHLANMTSGYARGEDPGEAWAYNDYSIMLYFHSLLGGVYDVSLTNAEAVASLFTHPERLGPLQFEDGSLFTIIKDAPRLHMTPRDFARVGWFWLNKGNWNGQQLLPTSYFDTYLKPHVSNDLPLTSSRASDYLEIGTYGGHSNEFPHGPGIYGFNWWFNAQVGTSDELTWPHAPTDTYQANGHMEREIMTIIPSLNMVVAARGDWGTFEPGNADAGMNQNLKLLSESAIGPAPNTIVSSTPVPSDEGFLPGQVILNPDNPRYMVYNRDDDADGQLDPFFWAGPGGPEDFFFRGSINPDGTRNGDQQAIIDAIGSSGANAMYVQMVRSHGGDGESTHNPWQNNDPGQPLNQAVLDQWDGWLAEMDRQGITVLLFFYDDSANPFPTGDAVSTHERSYIEGIVNAFEHHENIIWAIAEEYHEALSDTRTSAIAAEIRAADDHNHLIAVHHATGDNTMNFPDDPNIEIFAHQSDSTDETELHADVMTAFDDAAGRFPVVMSEGLNSHGPALQNGDRATLRRLNWATAMAGASVMVLGTWESSDQFGDGAPTEAMLADWGRQRQFFESTSFHEMVPDDSLKSGDTQHLLANPGEAYIAYASDLSESLGIHEMTAGTYTLTWLDTVSGATVTETQTVDAGSQHFAKPADLGSEVVLYIQKSGESPAAAD